MQDWRWMTATELGRGIENGAIDPVDLTQVYLDAIASHEFADRIYARVTADRAKAEAQAASTRAKAGKRLSALDGVPISWKDLFDSAGTPTEAGTAYLAGRTPEQDADVLAAATEAGLVCLGKTHMTEIAFSGLGVNPVTQTPPNVHDDSAAPGGSSSGAAASVAFGLAAAGIGSDTGGSVRVPSAWNNLVGFKTTHGRMSLGGVVPLCKTFDTVGPLCRSVEDAALLTAIMAGQGGQVIEKDGKNLRLAVLDTIAMEDIRADQRRAFDDAVEKLQAAGATVEHIEFDPMHYAFELAGMLYTVDAYAEWQYIIESDPDKMYHQILKRIRPGADFSAVDYLRGWDTLWNIRAVYQDETADFDAVIMPSSPIGAPNVERLLTDDDYFVAENLLALRNTRVANLMGGCSITLPTAVPMAGIMLNAGADQDESLLEIALAVEHALA